MSEFHEMPEQVDWAGLIRTLRSTYTKGDGGLPKESGIAPHVLTDGYLGGVKSYANAARLWNLAVHKYRAGEISSFELGACVISSDITHRGEIQR